MARIYWGVDPGSNGGIAYIDQNENSVESVKMPATMQDIYDELLSRTLVEGFDKNNVTVILEDVGQGMPGQSSKATATFAEHVGCLKMALYALGLKTVLVKPQKWQKEYSGTIGNGKGLSKTEWKNKLKGLAQSLFPSMKVTLWSADDLLMAEYGRRNNL